VAMKPGNQTVVMVKRKLITLPLIRYAADEVLKLPEEPGVFILAGERWVIVGWDDSAKALVCERWDDLTPFVSDVQIKKGR